METRTPGSASGPRKRIGSNADTAPRADSTSARVCPVPATPVWPFRSSTPGDSSRPAPSRIPGVLHGLCQIHTGSAPPASRNRGSLDDAADFGSRCGPAGQLLHPASTPASRPEPGASLPRTLASPRSGLAPPGRPRTCRPVTSCDRLTMCDLSSAARGGVDELKILAEIGA